MPSSAKPLPTNLAIFVTFHFAVERLTYLRRISKECTSLGHSVKAYIFTNDVKQHTTTQRAIAWLDLATEILSPTLLGHPYLLTWLHLSKDRELFEEDPSVSHYLYLEGDICFTETNIT
jgi:hypothetical protein